MLNIAVCDDDLIHRQDLLTMLCRTLDLNATRYLLSEFNSGEELIESMEEFDIYFLDMRMDKLSGIETAKKIRQTNENAGIVFVTALKEYVFDAFDVRAFHYILKPVDENKLNEVLHSLIAHIDKKSPYIIIKALNQSHKILLKDITYIEARLRKVIVHTNTTTFEYYYKLSDIEEETQDHYFFRCHKSYIVNLRYVHSYDNNHITLTNSERVYLSKHKYTDFAKAFMYYLKSGEY